MVGATNDHVDWAFGYVNLANQFSRWVVDEDLAICDIDIAAVVDGYALAAALDKRLEIGESAVCADGDAVCAVFRRADDIDLLADRRGNESIGVEIVREPPARCVGRRSLLEDAACREKDAAIGRGILALLWRRHISGEHLRQRCVDHRDQIELVFELAVVPVVGGQNHLRARVMR